MTDEGFGNQEEFSVAEEAGQPSLLAVSPTVGPFVLLCHLLWYALQCLHSKQALARQGSVQLTYL